MNNKNKIKINIDNKQIIAYQNESILEAAIRNKIDIPNLCYHKKISKSESCRLCIVKIKGKNGFFTSCGTQIQENMKIIAFDNELEQHRKMILDMIISNHNDDCINCNNNGNCKLQDLIFKYDLGKNSRSLNKILKNNKKYESRIINFDQSKCIQCDICIKSCSEIQCKDILSYKNRGIQTSITTGYNNWKESKCDGCGECSQNCVTGAMSFKNTYNIKNKFNKKNIEKDIITTCPYCAIGCQIKISTIKNKIAHIEGIDTIPNYGSLCVKGRFGLDYIHNNKRLKYPLIKVGKDFKRISWEKAISIIASKLNNIKDKYGNDSIGVIASAKCTNEDNYLLQKFTRTIIKTNNIDNCARLCHAPTMAILSKVLGSSAMTNSISDLKNSNIIMIIGSNTTENHPVIANIIKQSIIYNNKKLIVIDPRKTDIAKYANIWCDINHGTDVAFLNGIIHIIIKEKLYDIEFIKNNVNNFEEIIENTKQYTPDKVEIITGIKSAKLIEIAKLYSSSKKSSIIWAMGITQHQRGSDSVKAITTLSLITGNIGKNGAGLYPLRGQNNVQGACDMGTLPNYYPGYNTINQQNIEYFQNKWQCASLPLSDGINLNDMINNCGNSIKAMYIMGNNPVISNANSNKVINKLQSLDFLVCQDIFLTETAKEAAHIILPAKSILEKNGTSTNTERRVLPINKVIINKQPKEDWEIIQLIAKKMGANWHYKKWTDVFNEINSTIKQYNGITLKRLNKKIQWPCDNIEHDGTEILYKKGFYTKNKKVNLLPAYYKKNNNLPNKKYPFLLTTGRSLFHYHTGTMSRNSKILNEYQKKPVNEMNINDMIKHNIKNEEFVNVISKIGKITIKVHQSSKLKRLHVFIPFHFNEAIVNKLIDDEDADYIAKTPSFKICPVKIEKLTENNKL